MTIRPLLLAAIGTATLTAACTTTPQYPVDYPAAPGPAPAPTRPVPPPAAAPVRPSDDAPRAVPSGSVGRSELPPLGAPAPGPAAPASVQAPTPPPPVAAGPPLEAPGRYVVAAGDTLYGIARRYQLSPGAFASYNAMPLDSRVRTGQRLEIPAGARDGGPQPGATGALAGAPPARTAPPPPITRPAAPPPVSRPTPPLVTTPVPPRAAPTTSAPGTRPPPPALPPQASAPEGDPVAAGRGRFQWPVRGEVLSEFGPKGVGQRNDGLNIAAEAGASIRAAAGGEVVYAGDAVPGFGTLVLIRHAGGWVTAYGHLQRALVKNRDSVAQGQEIGQAGVSGGVSRPQLHFEVRFTPTPRDRARPIDPRLVLP